MGKQFLVKSDYRGVRYSLANPKSYNGGDTATLTDADYAALSAALTRTVNLASVTTVADPAYPADPFIDTTVGANELAYAENVTGVGTTATSAAGGGAGTEVAIPGTTITVTDSASRPVTIRFKANAQQTAVGTGVLLLSLTETTSTPTDLTSSLADLPNSTTLPAAFLGSLVGDYRIGVVTTTRTFRLSITVWGQSGVTPAVQVFNAGNNPTTIQALAG
jgi:hypothetical protein